MILLEEENIPNFSQNEFEQQMPVLDDVEFMD